MTTTIPTASLRAALLAALLATLQPGHAFAAGELFRWIEPDGSLTFSPTPPVDGTPFTAVDPASLRSPDENRGGNEARSRIAAANAPAPLAAGRSFPPAGVRKGGDRAPAAVENERCNELSKRVVSLERRLTAALTPEEMDDTVIRMARYQQSFESLCR